MTAESLDFAIKLLTGRPAPARLTEPLAGIYDPLKMREAILKDPALFSSVPEFRLLFEIMALRQARQAGTVKLVIGAAGTTFRGWVSTNENLLNLLFPERWAAWLDENSVDAMVAEHVWEHLDAEEAEQAARTCFRFLRPGARLRVAVPDQYHPSEDYRALCGVGNNDGHKVFYNYKTLSSVFDNAGLEPALIEYWDEDRQFHCSEWSSEDGHIGRSSKNDWRNKNGELNYTSLIMDAIKPTDRFE